MALAPPASPSLALRAPAGRLERWLGALNQESPGGRGVGQSDGLATTSYRASESGKLVGRGERNGSQGQCAPSQP